MSVAALAQRCARRLLHPTARARLAALYGALILATGSALLTVVYLVLKQNIDAKDAAGAKLSSAAGAALSPKAAAALATLNSARRLSAIAAHTRYDTLHHLLVVSVLSLAAFTVVAFAAGWWLAGRVLAPVHRITAAARTLSSQNLSERIGLQGPQDELKELADTIDQVLDRLEAAFDSQRRFIANASHELRTPLGIQRTAIELGLADPSPEELAEVRGHLLAANRRTEDLIDGLLLLALCDGGLRQREPVDLAAVAAEAAEEQAAAAVAAGVTLRVGGKLAAGPGAAADVAGQEGRPGEQPCWVSGDPVLLGRLAANLVGNAIRYNYPGGTVDVTPGPSSLLVTNTGPRVPADQIPRLFEPFTRLAGSRGRHDGGAGLGLSIVRSVAAAHGGMATAEPGPQGGLRVLVTLPAVAPSAAGPGLSFAQPHA